MRKITRQHRVAARSIGMDPGEFADELDRVRIQLRQNFRSSGTSRLVAIADADDETFDAFLRESRK